MSTAINQDVINFCIWFMPVWRFYDLDEWENAETGERVSTEELYKLYKEAD